MQASSKGRKGREGFRSGWVTSAGSLPRELGGGRRAYREEGLGRRISWVLIQRSPHVAGLRYGVAAWSRMLDVGWSGFLSPSLPSSSLSASFTRFSSVCLHSWRSDLCCLLVPPPPAFPLHSSSLLFPLLR